jgi:hypothetical protein
VNYPPLDRHGTYLATVAGVDIYEGRHVDPKHYSVRWGSSTGLTAQGYFGGSDRWGQLATMMRSKVGPGALTEAQIDAVLAYLAMRDT